MKIKQIALDTGPGDYVALYALTDTGRIFVKPPFLDQDWEEVDTTFFAGDEHES